MEKEKKRRRGRQQKQHQQAEEQQQQWKEGSLATLASTEEPLKIIEYPTAELITYVYNVDNLLSDSPPEDLDLFCENVFIEMSTQAPQVMAHPTCSAIVQKFIQNAPSYKVLEFWQQTLTDPDWIITLSYHQFASHVMQSLLIKIAALAYNEDDAAKTIILSFCQILQPRLLQLLTNRYGSHVLRTILCILARKRPSSKANPTAMQSRRSKKWAQGHGLEELMNSVLKETSTEEPPKSFLSMLTAFIKEISSSQYLDQLLSDELASPVLQLVLSFSKELDEEACQTLMDKMLQGAMSQNSPTMEESQVEFIHTALIVNPIGSHLMERILHYIQPQYFQKLFSCCFRGRLKEYAFHHVANFVVQKLISQLRQSAQLELVLEELSPFLAQLREKNHQGVFLSLANASISLNTKYSNVLAAIIQAFEITSSEDRLLLVEAVLQLQPVKKCCVPSNPSWRPQVQGALLLQLLLDFPADFIDPLTSSISHLSKDDLFKWAAHPVSSRVLEKFCTSNNVKLKAKRKWIQDWLGSFHLLACDCYGSHLLDKIWTFSDIQIKAQIAEELLFHEQRLFHDKYGRFALRNCGIAEFKRKREAWDAKQQILTKKKKLFQDILEDAKEAEKVKPHANAQELMLADSDTEDVVMGSGGVKGKRDEIDELFKGHALDKPVVKATTMSKETTENLIVEALEKAASSKHKHKSKDKKKKKEEKSREKHKKKKSK